MSMTPIEIIGLVLWIMRLLKAFGFGPQDVKPIATDLLAKKDEGAANRVADVPDDVIAGLFNWA